MVKSQPKIKADQDRTKQELLTELNLLRRHLAAAESTAELRLSFLDFVPAAIISIDENQCIQFFNHGAENTFGYSAKEIIGKSLDLLLPKDLRQAHQKYVSEFEKSASSISRQMNERSDIQALRKDGTQFPAKATIAKFQHNEEEILTVFLRDITDVRSAEESIQQSREELAHLSRVGLLGEISASIAHELNQPLAAILTNAQAVAYQLDSDSIDFGGFDSAIGDVISDAKRAAEVIKRLRSLLQPGERKFEETNINELIADVTELLRSEVIINGISLSMELAPDMPNVSIDRIQIQQVLLNLLTNAFDSMSNVDLNEKHLKMCTRMIGRQTIEVSVQDAGAGIEDASLRKLFEPFFSTKDHGMGMGLAISKTILQTHAGRIWAKNNEGAGAVFSFSLPVVSSSAESEGQKNNITSLGQEAGQQSDAVTIFVVDDDDSFRTAILRLLRIAGYEAKGFCSAEDFLQSPPHLGSGCLLIDLHMPGKTGLELQARLNAGDNTLPAIFLTGAGDTASGVLAMKQGAIDFLSKPVDEQEILKAISDAVELSNAARLLKVQQAEANEKISLLTRREVEVMNLVAQGLKNKQIAYELSIAEKTVKTHRGHLMHKLEVATVPDLIQLIENKGKNG